MTQADSRKFELNSNVTRPKSNNLIRVEQNVNLTPRKNPIMQNPEKNLKMIMKPTAMKPRASARFATL